MVVKCHCDDVRVDSCGSLSHCGSFLSRKDAVYKMSFCPMILDGNPLKEGELARPNFGPIGSKPNDCYTRDAQKGEYSFNSEALKFLWVSDFATADGHLLTEDLRGTGFTPCLPKVPAEYIRTIPFNPPVSVLGPAPPTFTNRSHMQWNSLKNDEDLVSSAVRYLLLESGENGDYSSIRSNTSSPESGYSSSVASLNSSLSDSCTSLDSISSGNELSSFTEVYKNFPMSRKKGWPRCSNDYDIVDFIQRFGYPGATVRPSYFHRPRSGKYFIKFKE